MRLINKMPLDFEDKNKITEENKKAIEDIKDKFSLSQSEVHLFGELLLEKIQREYQGLL
jgi:hypothetical protein